MVLIVAYKNLLVGQCNPQMKNSEVVNARGRWMIHEQFLQSNAVTESHHLKLFFAPALHETDIGLVMGIAGAEVIFRIDN